MKTISTSLKMCFVALFLSVSLLMQAKTLTTVTSSAASDWGEPCANAFDGNTSTMWSQPTPSYTGWIQIQYTTPVAWNAYAITCTNDARQRDFKTWTLSGSNNGTAWDVLDTQTNQVWAAPSSLKTYGFTNAVLYSYYKFEFTNNGNSYTQVSEIAFSTVLGADVTAPSIPEGLSLSLLTPTSGTLSWTASSDLSGVTGYTLYKNGTLFGTSATNSLVVTGLVAGDKLTVSATDGAATPNTSIPSAELTVSISYPIVTASSAHSESYWNDPATNALDANTSTKWSATGGSEWLQLQYATGQVVTGYKVTNADDGARYPLTCSLEGSNDGSIWVPLDGAGQTGLSWTGNFTEKTFTFSNTTAYTFYKFSGTAVQNFTIAELQLTGISTGVAKTTLEGINVYTQAGQIVTDLSAMNGSSIVSIIDAKGAVLKTVNNANGLVSISVANKGIYLVRIQNGAKNYTQKVVLN